MKRWFQNKSSAMLSKNIAVSDPFCSGENLWLTLTGQKGSNERFGFRLFLDGRFTCLLFGSLCIDVSTHRLQGETRNFPHRPSLIPRRNHRQRFPFSSPVTAALPILTPVGLSITVFEACSVFARIRACMLAKSLSQPSTPEASAASSAPRRFRLLPVGTNISGRDSHPLEESALARSTLNFG